MEFKVYYVCHHFPKKTMPRRETKVYCQNEKWYKFKTQKAFSHLTQNTHALLSMGISSLRSTLIGLGLIWL